MIRQDELIMIYLILLAVLALVVCTVLWAPKPSHEVCTIQFKDGETQEAIGCDIIAAQTARCGDTIYSQFKQITCR